MNNTLSSIRSKKEFLTKLMHSILNDRSSVYMFVKKRPKNKHSRDIPRIHSYADFW